MAHGRFHPLPITKAQTRRGVVRLSEQRQQLDLGLWHWG